MFTCETRGSTVLAWTSDEYIEAGGKWAWPTYFMHICTYNPTMCMKYVGHAHLIKTTPHLITSP